MVLDGRSAQSVIQRRRLLKRRRNMIRTVSGKPICGFHTAQPVYGRGTIGRVTHPVADDRCRDLGMKLNTPRTIPNAYGLHWAAVATGKNDCAIRQPLCRDAVPFHHWKHLWEITKNRIIDDTMDV